MDKSAESFKFCVIQISQKVALRTAALRLNLLKPVAVVYGTDGNRISASREYFCMKLHAIPNFAGWRRGKTLDCRPAQSSHL